MTSGLVDASISLPEWQAVKMIFFVPCISHSLDIDKFCDRAPLKYPILKVKGPQPIMLSKAKGNTPHMQELRYSVE